MPTLEILLTQVVFHDVITIWRQPLDFVTIYRCMAGR